MIKSVPQGLGYTLPVTFTTHGSVLPVPGNGNCVFVSVLIILQTLVSKGCYDYLLLCSPYDHLAIVSRGH